MKEKHRHLIQNLHSKQQATRNDLLLVQVKRERRTNLDKIRTICLFSETKIRTMCGI